MRNRLFHRRISCFRAFQCMTFFLSSAIFFRFSDCLSQDTNYFNVFFSSLHFCRLVCVTSHRILNQNEKCISVLHRQRHLVRARWWALSTVNRMECDLFLFLSLFLIYSNIICHLYYYRRRRHMFFRSVHRCRHVAVDAIAIQAIEMQYEHKTRSSRADIAWNSSVWLYVSLCMCVCGRYCCWYDIVFSFNSFVRVFVFSYFRPFVVLLMGKKHQQKFVHHHLVVTRSYPINRFSFVTDDMNWSESEWSGSGNGGVINVIRSHTNGRLLMGRKLKIFSVSRQRRHRHVLNGTDYVIYFALLLDINHWTDHLHARSCQHRFSQQ